MSSEMRIVARVRMVRAPWGSRYLNRGSNRTTRFDRLGLAAGDLLAGAYLQRVPSGT